MRNLAVVTEWCVSGAEERSFEGGGGMYVAAACLQRSLLL